MCVIVGGVLLTVKKNESNAVLPLPSSTVTVMVLVPNCPATGVTVIVRFAPLPLSEMLVNRAVFDDTADTVKSATGVSASPIVKPIATAAPVLA